jgi:hypothetical protein
MAGSEAVKFIINHAEVSCAFVHSIQFDLVWSTELRVAERLHAERTTVQFLFTV